MLKNPLKTGNKLDMKPLPGIKNTLSKKLFQVFALYLEQNRRSRLVAIQNHAGMEAGSEIGAKTDAIVADKDKGQGQGQR